MASPNKTIEIHALPPQEVEASLINPDAGMLIMTWIVFLLLLAVLYKFAWKPILSALDERENSIKRSLEDVERIKKEMEKMDEKCAQLIADAHEKSEDIINQSKKAAKDAANIIEAKAKEEAEISLENAIRDIKEEAEKAQMRLREEGAQLAIDLAEKLINENMNTEKNRTLINRFIKEI